MTSVSWLSSKAVPRAGDISRPRAIDDEARGAPVERKSDSAGSGGGVLLPLKWAEGDQDCSRLPFRSRGKRDSVRRLLCADGRTGAAVVLLLVLLLGGGAGE
jgi:hypothetical protein